MTQLLLFLVAGDGLFTSVLLLFPLTSVLPIYLQLLLYDSTILFLIAVDRLQFSPIDIRLATSLFPDNTKWIKLRLKMKNQEGEKLEEEEIDLWPFNGHEY